MSNFNIYIDMSNNTYRFIGQNKNTQIKTDVFNFLSDTIDTYIPSNTNKEIKTFLNKENIKKLLKENVNISKDFYIGPTCIHVTALTVDTDEDGNPAHIICSFDIEDSDSRETQDKAIRNFMNLMLKSEDKESLIDDLIESVGHYFDADRAYIFEIDEGTKSVINTYEWCKEGVVHEKENLQQVPLEVINPWVNEFRKKGCFYISCDDEYAEKEPIVYEVLEPQNIQSLMAAPLVHTGKIIGFLGVDNPKQHVDQQLFLSVAAAVLNHEVLAKSERTKEEKYKKVLQQTTEAAQAANVAKTSFLFNMSHDIRTPINAIMGFRDLLEKHQNNPDKRADYLNKIKEASTVLLSIINNVLEMARIEKGTLEINESIINIDNYIETICTVFKELMDEKGITFESNINVQHHYVFCDETKMHEILFNLLSNAYKYTKTGGTVRFTFEEIPSNDEKMAMFKTTVADTGIGMSEEFQSHIFEEFSRENNTTEGKVEGTGLGMPIVKRLVEMLNGTIEVKSEKGVGSTFTVTIPLRISDETSLPEEHKETKIDHSLFKGKRILLAEDNDLNAEIAIEILKEEGFEVERAEDGKICVDMLKKADPGYYGLILMDIQMPNMNGYEATKEIRNLEDQSKADIVIIAMTANAFEEDKQNALKAGMNWHLAKPINVDELLRALSVVFAKTS